MGCFPNSEMTQGLWLGKAATNFEHSNSPRVKIQVTCSDKVASRARHWEETLELQELSMVYIFHVSKLPHRGCHRPETRAIIIKRDRSR